jgi:uncharacterized protein (TIGR02453 family)
MAEEFAGLPRGMIGFLAGLEANNARDWFEAHRADYEALWLTPGLDLAAALSGPVAKMGLMAVPKLNGSLRRIHRDTRFSPDKRPYSPHLHLILSAGPAFNRAAGVHLVFGPEGFGHGVGQWAPEPAQLETLRRAFCDPAARAAFLALAAKAEALGESLGPPDLARLPKAFAGEAGDWTHLLRRKSIVMRTRGATPLPDWLFGPECLAGLEALVADLAPLALWLQAQG